MRKALILTTIILISILSTIHVFNASYTSTPNNITPLSSVAYNVSLEWSRYSIPPIVDYYWNPNHTLIAVIGVDGAIYILDPSTYEVYGPIESGVTSYLDVEWSSDGSILTYGVLSYPNYPATDIMTIVFYNLSQNIKDNVGFLINGIRGMHFEWSPIDNILAVPTHIGVYLIRGNNLFGGTLISYNVTNATYAATHWSPDGRLLAAIYNTTDRLLHLVIFDPVNTSIMWSQDFPNKRLVSLNWSPSGTHLFIALFDYYNNTGNLYVYGRNGSLQWKIEGIRVYKIRFSPDSNKVLIYGKQERTRLLLYHLNGTLLWSKTPEGYLSSIQWSPDGNRIVVARYIGRTTGTWLTAYDAITGDEVWTETGIGYKVSSLSISPDSSLIAVGVLFSRENNVSRVVVYDTDGYYKWSSEYMYGDVIKRVSWSSDGSLLAVGTDVFKRLLIYSRNGSLLWRSDYYGYNNSVSWSHDGSKLLAAGSNGVIHIFSVDGEILKTIPLNDSIIWSAKWSPTLPVFAVLSSRHNESHWGLMGSFWLFYENGSLIDHYSWDEMFDLIYLRYLEWSPNGYMYATLKTFIVDNVSSLLSPSPFSFEYYNASAFSWSPDSRMIAVSIYDGVYLYDAESGTFNHTRFYSSDANDLCWSPRGDMIAITGMRTEVVGLNGTILWSAPGDARCDWSSDGEILVTGGEFWVYAYDRNGNRLWSASVGASIVDIQWDPTGSLVAVLYALDYQDVYDDPIGSYYRITLFDRQGNTVWESPVFYSYNCTPNNIAWSPDGRRLAVSVGTVTNSSKVGPAKGLLVYRIETTTIEQPNTTTTQPTTTTTTAPTESQTSHTTTPPATSTSGITTSHTTIPQTTDIAGTEQSTTEPANRTGSPTASSSMGEPPARSEQGNIKYLIVIVIIVIVMLIIYKIRGI